MTGFRKRSGLLLVLAAVLGFRAAADQSVRAVAEPERLKAEPIRYWWTKPKAALPGAVSAKMYVRVASAAEAVAVTTHAIGAYFPPKSVRLLRPGEAWEEVTALLTPGYRNVFSAEARGAKGRLLKKGVARPDVRVEFSTDGRNVCGALESGGGALACGLVSLLRGTVESDVALSAADLARARAAGPMPAKRPVRFPVSLSNAISPALMSAQAFSNELEVLRRLGVSDAGAATATLLDPSHVGEPPLLFRGPSGDMMGSYTHGCICAPDYVRITNGFLRLRKECAGELARGRKLIVSLMDEPHYDVARVTNCTARIPTEHRRRAAAFDLTSDDPRAQLAAIAYRDELVANYYAAYRDVARGMGLTNVLLTANVGISLVFSGNACEPGTSPFQMADRGLVGMGLTEDWCNLQRTRQFSSYMCDVYRAAMARNGLDFALVSILLAPAETEAKAYAEVGHGARALHFFSYGPHWLRGDHKNTVAGMYPAIRRFCAATAAAEEALVAARPAKGDAALLFSESGDRLEIFPGKKRNWIERNPYGKDRMATSLMLTHCGVRTDVLDEVAVERELAGYRVLFAADRCVRRSTLAAIVRWLRAGGTLVKTRDALTGDEVGRPLREGALAKTGRVIELDFSPWRDYVKPAKRTGECTSHRLFDEALRGRMAAAASAAGVRRRIFTDVPLVEASLLESADGGVIVLSSWSPAPRVHVRVTFDAAGRAARFRSATGAPLAVRREGARVLLETEVGRGDYLVFSK